MRKTAFALSLAAIVGSLVWNCCAACATRPESCGLPPRLTTLTDLGPVLRRTDLTAVQKTEILIVWLTEERSHPTPTSKGIGGGEINSSYIQAQIIKSLCEAGDPLSLRQIDSDENADANVRDGARIALALMGDSTQIPKMIGILRSQTEPYFRVTAAEALGALGATAAIPALEQALLDGYTATAGGHRPPEPSTVYPVREAAQTALRVLEMPDSELTKHVQEKTARFEQRLQAALRERSSAP